MQDRRGPEDFFAMHRHGFVRVATSTPRVRPADVGFNRDAILEEARRADAAGVDLAVFPELCVSSYAIDDLHQQSALLDAVEDAVGDDRRGQRRSGAGAADRRAAAASGRLYNCALAISRGQGARGGAEELPAELPGVLREALVRARPQRRGADDPGGRAGAPLRLGPDLRGEPTSPASCSTWRSARTSGRRPRRRRRRRWRAPPSLPTSPPRTSPSASPTSATCSAARSRRAPSPPMPIRPPAPARAPPTSHGTARG